MARTQPPPQEPAAPREPVEEPPAPTAETPPAPPPADSEAAPTSETPPPRPPRPRPAPPPSWPFNLAEDRYVLQLMGSHERASVARLITRHELEDPSAVVDLVHEGRPWYVLIHGAYASRDEAVGAIRRLAPELRALRPWARSVASLRANLSPHPP
ncbi:MAG: SPOR domain-containing protein [Gammaproteobacteria bacterium]|nr:SPOR domain-containing protein [Gammaproteobacteria bacterium]